MLKSSSYTIFRSFATATEHLVIERHITFLWFHFPFLFLVRDFRMILEWRPSFGYHVDIICSSSVLPSYPSTALFLLALKKGCITLAASILISTMPFFVAFLTDYLLWECARHCITESNLTQPSPQVLKPPSCSFSCEATSFFRCKGSMRRPFRLWATGTTPYWPMILWKSSFFFSHFVLQLPLPTKRVFAENTLAHPSICITLIAPVKFDV